MDSKKLSNKKKMVYELRVKIEDRELIKYFEGITNAFQRKFVVEQAMKYYLNNANNEIYNSNSSVLDNIIKKQKILEDKIETLMNQKNTEKKEVNSNLTNNNNNKTHDNF